MGERTVTCPTCGAPALWLDEAAYRVPADEDGDVP